MTTVPVLDFGPIARIQLADGEAWRDAAHADDTRQVVEDFDRAMRRFGFVQITGHGVSRSSLSSLRTNADSFFNQEHEEKMRLNLSEHYGAAGGGFEPIDVDIVLHREGNARQRKRVAGGDPRVDVFSLRAKPFCRCATDPDLRLDRVVSLDPRKRFVQHGKRGGFATVHCRRDLRGTLAFGLAHGRLDSAMSGAPGSIGWRSSM